MIDKRLATRLGLRGKGIEMSIRGLWSSTVNSQCEKLSFNIRGVAGELAVEHALSVPKLSLPIQSLPRTVTEQIKILENVEIKPYKNARPLILIGQDNWHLIATYEIRKIDKSGLAISRGPLGWLVHGYISDVKREIRSLCTHASTDLNDELVGVESEKYRVLDELIHNYVNLENLGVSDSISKTRKHDRSEEILSKTTCKIDKGWETGLLWKSDSPPMNDGRVTAERRLHLLERKLDSNSRFAELYYKEMNRFIESGYASRIDPKSKGLRTWYLPHFGVENLNKPGKVRLVFDAAAKSGGISLNDQLLTGPDLLKSLIGVLLRFRQYAIAIRSDIKDMFLRIGVRVEDRGAQRFLFRGKDRDRDPDVYEMRVLIFGSKASPCSAIYVKNKNAESFSMDFPEAASSIIESCYMDDYLTSCGTVEEARKLVRDVIYINKEANFEMHGWASNEPRVIENVPSADKLKKHSIANLCDIEERVLGLFWDRNSDSLSFNVGLGKIDPEIVNGRRKPTKRDVFSIIMSVYDPLGILAPFFLRAKLLMQMICRSGVKWDKPIYDEEFDAWQKWLTALREVKGCKIPRSYIPRGEEYAHSQLHIFGDASSKAYAAVAYLRTVSQNGKIHVSLVMSKTRVAPVKPMTIPRLELQAALLSARLAATVGEELQIKIDERIFWSDSTTVLHWIRSEPQSKNVFVANRLGEIAEITRMNEWRWVPTEDNPADDATRATDRIMQANDRWFIGAKLLYNTPDFWPLQKQPSREKIKEMNQEESRKIFVGASSLRTVEVSTIVKLLGWDGLLMSGKRLRYYARRWVIRWRESKLEQGLMPGTWSDRWQAVPERADARERTILAVRYWYREIQSVCLPEDLHAIENRKDLARGSKLRGLKPYLDDEGLLRARGRVSRIDNSEFENTPIILDAAHYATKLLIAHYHRQFDHANNETVVNEMRQRFYVIGLRNRLRWLAKQCIVCRVQRAKPQNPPMADLPKSRVAYGLRPFAHCGIDYFGPVHVKIGRQRHKRWVVLFTCMTTRAVHIEIAYTLDASSTILALRRLAGRRGFPLRVYSDNGTNFTKASKELKNAIALMDADEMTYFAQAKRFDWHFNPPEAPHMGGAWERLVRSVKTALNHTLGDESYSEEVLQTVLIEVEHMVNSRPLTHVSIDPSDEEALTPNHFLIGSSSGYPNLERYENSLINPRKQFEISQQLLRSFWARWLREYLPTLLPRKKWHVAGESVKIGDVVLMVDYQAPRNTWRKGKIVAIFPGPDGVNRVAKVKSNNSYYVRPTHKLIRIFRDEGVES